MAHAWRWLRSLVFSVTIYAAMLPIGLAYLPWTIAHRDGAVAAAHRWCRFVTWLARVLLGLRCEVRGTPPEGEVMIAAKHQSFLDIILIYGAVPRGRFIMKKELVYAPILGQIALRLGCVPVDRGKRGAAIKQMMADVRAGRADPGQLIIYPQGTRVAPGVAAPYKMGTAALYRELGQPCVPVACNVGVFWPKRGVLRRPGTAIVEFLPEIPAGLAAPDFMARLEQEIETRSDRLLAEAGFPIAVGPR
nr:lysophospholipid acyltransferase family protein [Limimaricola hongkongensis]